MPYSLSSFKQIPIRLHISYLFTILIVIFSFFNNIIEYYQVKKILLKESRKEVSILKEKIVYQLKDIYNNNELLISILAYHSFPDKYSVDWYITHLNFFVAALDNIPALSGIYLGFEDGSAFTLRPFRKEKFFGFPVAIPKETAWVVQSRKQPDVNEVFFFDERLQPIHRWKDPRVDFDPRTRPWYTYAWKKNGNLYVTDPYPDFSTQEPIVSFSRKLKQGNGVIGVAIDLSIINTLFKKENITDHSQIALINTNGQVISWYGGKDFENDLITKNSLLPFLKDLPSPVLSGFYENLHRSGKVSDFLFEALGQQWQGEFSVLPIYNHTNFCLILVSPLHEILADALDSQKTLFIFSFFVLVFGILMAWWFAKIAARPLYKLMLEVNRIERFDFSHPVKVKSNILEINQLILRIDHMKTTIRRFLDLSRALSENKHFPSLLNSVLQQMQDNTEAKGGIIYLADERNTSFVPVKALWNNTLLDEDSMHSLSIIHLCSSSEHPIARALHEDGKQLRLSKKTIATWFSNIPCDQEMTTALVIPLLIRKSERIGILVLFIDEDQPTITPERLAFAEALAHSVAIALYTQHLINQQKHLLHSFIQVIAGAIDAKSSHTGWHCRRLPIIVELLAKAACNTTSGPFAKFTLDDEGWETLKIAAWLHDCGKVTTPEHVIDKGAKLETLYNRIHEIRMRFEVLKRDAEIACWKAISQGKDPLVEKEKCKALHQALLEDYLFIAECNIGGEAMSDEAIARLNEIAERRWLRTLPDDVGLSEDERLRKGPTPRLPVEEKLLADKPEHRIERPASQIIPKDNPWGFRMEVPTHLYDHGELHNLSIQRGTINDEERYKINEHIIQTVLMLEKLPFPDTLKRVPEIAVNHHERVDGKGYPRRLTGKQMSIEAKILAIADIFEALTAVDRPYKKGKMLSETLAIMRRMSETGHIDSDLFSLFIDSGIPHEYERLCGVTLDQAQ